MPQKEVIVNAQAIEAKFPGLMDKGLANPSKDDYYTYVLYKSFPLHIPIVSVRPLTSVPRTSKSERPNDHGNRRRKSFSSEKCTIRVSCSLNSMSRRDFMSSFFVSAPSSPVIV